MKMDGVTVTGVPEADPGPYTNEEGKASPQFVHFPFTAEAIAPEFKTQGQPGDLGSATLEYSHRMQSALNS